MGAAYFLKNRDLGSIELPKQPREGAAHFLINRDPIDPKIALGDLLDA